MQSCLMGAPQLADWMTQHPAERLAAWRCVIGEQGGSGELSASGPQFGEAQSNATPETTSEHATIGRRK
jgi:hypothetical protein